VARVREPSGTPSARLSALGRWRQSPPLQKGSATLSPILIRQTSHRPSLLLMALAAASLFPTASLAKQRAVVGPRGSTAESSRFSDRVRRGAASGASRWCAASDGKILYARDPGPSLSPASNMKLFTTAAALENLARTLSSARRWRATPSGPGRPCGRPLSGGARRLELEWSRLALPVEDGARPARRRGA